MMQGMPNFTTIPLSPVSLVHADLNAVGVGPLVPVPEQHVYPVDDAGHAQLHHNPLVPSLVNGVSRKTSLHVVIFAVSVQQGTLHFSHQDLSPMPWYSHVFIGHLVPSVTELCIAGLCPRLNRIKKNVRRH